MWNVVVVGAGTMGTVHARAHHGNKDAHVVGIVDVNPEAGQRLATECETSYFPSLEQALASGQVDVVDVCLPTHLHREFVERAAAAGKHVICEKPIARSLEDARAMIQACDAAGVQLFIGHVVRFFPEYVRARDMVLAGRVGQVGTVRTVRGGVFPVASNNWYANEDYSGGVIVDTIIHDFDFLRWTLGDVTRVYAKGLAGSGMDQIDHAFVSLRFANGTIGHVEGTWAFPSGFHTELEFAGDSGIVQHRSEEAASIQAALRVREGGSAGVIVPESPLAQSPYEAELEHFIDCLSTGKPPIITAEDAYRALEISLAALESIQTGQPVLLGGRDAE